MARAEELKNMLKPVRRKHSPKPSILPGYGTTRSRPPSATTLNRTRNDSTGSFETGVDAAKYAELSKYNGIEEVYDHVAIKI